MIELKIDPEFKNKIPPLTEEEFKQLEENIVSDGEVYEPIVAWNGTIVDGHNRWAIVQKHPEIPYKVKEMEFADKWAAFDWMYKKQLGRRNLSDEQKTYLLGKLYEARKQSRGNNAERGENGKYLRTQNGNTGEPRGRIGEIIAKEQGVGHGTVLRAADFAKGVDALREVSTVAADRVLEGKSKATKGAVAELKTASAEEVKRFADDVLEGKPVKEKRDGNWANKETKERYAKIRDIAEQMGTEQGGTSFDDVLRLLDAAENEFISKIERMIESEKETLTSDERWPHAIEGYFDSVIADINDLKGRIIK